MVIVLLLHVYVHQDKYVAWVLVCHSCSLSDDDLLGNRTGLSPTP